MPTVYLRVQIKNSMYSRKNALKKYTPPWLTDEEKFGILNSNSHLEVLWKEICFVGPVVFYCIISLLIAFHFIALFIAFSK